MGWVSHRFILKQKEAQQSQQGKSLLILLWFLNPYLAFRHELYLDLFWFLCFLATYFSIHRRIWLTSIGVGLACATHQLAWIMAPFWLMEVTVGKKRNALIQASLLTAVIAMTFLGGFYLKEGSDFTSAIFMHLNWANQPYRGELCLGLASGFYALGIQFILKYLQFILLISSGVFGLNQWFRSKPSSLIPFYFIRGGVLVWFAFISLSHFIENYFYLAPLWVALWISTLNLNEQKNSPFYQN
jgi:uncharacterized membrane protein